MGSRHAWLVVAVCLSAWATHGQSTLQPSSHNRSTGLVYDVANLQLSPNLDFGPSVVPAPESDRLITSTVVYGAG